MNYTIEVQPVGLSFNASADTTILDAALNDGMMLNHSCREGTCGSCKGQIVSGQVDHGDSDLELLNTAERASGLALFCRAKACSNLVIEAPEVTELRGISIQKTGARVASVDKVSHDVAVVRLQLPPSHSIAYYPGQYFNVLLKDGRGHRSYSMATQKPENNQLEFHIRQMPNGFFSSHVLTTMKPKEMLQLEGPYGSFYLRDTAAPMIFLASGTGFAPIQALLQQLEAQGNNRPVHLYWGGRIRSDLYRHAELLALEARAHWLHYTPVLSEPTAECDWHGATGFVHAQVLKDFSSLAEFEVYACGAPIVVESARKDYIGQRHLDGNKFYADAFV